ncbi:MAG TPA: pilin [Rhodanobacter sp.]|nr:pilin [Rhodanobacter sp.]
MEHLLRLANLTVILYAAVTLFTVGVVLWLAWARVFPGREGLKRISYGVMALSVLVLLVGCYASIVTKGLDGVACVVGRYSLDRMCFRHDERRWIFWVVLGWQVFFIGLLMLLALLSLVRMAVPGRPGTVAPGKHLRRATGTDARLPVVRKAKAGDAFQLLLFVVGGMVMATLAWVAMSLDRADDVRKQVAGAFASVAVEQAAVEAYLRDHGGLPDDNKMVALPSPADLHRYNVSDVEVVKGSLLLKFDAATADEHLAGRQVLLIAVRHERQVRWHCATLDVDVRYLPIHCPVDR